MKYDICVIGGCSIDCMFYTDEQGKYNEIPTKIVPGGKGANQAVASSRAGASVAIITLLGNDSEGKIILDNLKNNGVDTSGVELQEGLINDKADIYIDHLTKDNKIRRSTIATESFTIDLIKKYQDIILSSKMILIQSKIPHDVTSYIIEYCNNNNKPIILTPNMPERFINDLHLLDKVTYITCNKKEYIKLFQTEDLESKLSNYPNKLIVTLGSDGVMYHNSTKIIKIPANYVKNIKDTTGAGDTFTGNLAYNILNNNTLHNSIIEAQKASSKKIQYETAQQGMPFNN